MTPVRVALVGLGWAGRSIWLPRLLDHPAFRVVAAVDPDPSARAAVDPVATLPTVDGLGRSTVDLAVVAVPNHLHASVAVQLLEAGIPVFVEKPVCLDPAEADRMAAAERDGGAMLLAGSAARYRADVGALRELVPSLGRVRHVELAWTRSRGVPDGHGWFTRRRLAGGGALLDLGWHLIDTSGWLLGPLVFEQAAASVSADFVGDGTRGAAWRGPARPDPGTPAESAGADVEDTARAFLVTDDGVSLALRASWASHDRYDGTLVRVDGSLGTATLRCTFGFSPNRRPGSTLRIDRDGGEATVPVPDEPVGAEYRRQLDSLPGLLADPGNRGRAVAEARRTVEVIDRLYAAAGSSLTAAGV